MSTIYFYIFNYYFYCWNKLLNLNVDILYIDQKIDFLIKIVLKKEKITTNKNIKNNNKPQEQSFQDLTVNNNIKNNNSIKNNNKPQEQLFQDLTVNY